MAQRVSTTEVLKKNNTTFEKAKWADLKPDTNGVKVKKFRLIGMPIRFYQVGIFKKDPNDPKARKKVPFPDTHLNPLPTRTCDDDPKKCIWTNMGYLRNKRYAINAIDRDTGDVVILSKGGSVFDSIAESEQSNMEENLTLGDGEKLWTCAGGEVAPDVKIKVEKDDSALGGVKYTVTFVGNPKRLTDEEIASLKAIHEPTAEEIAQMRGEDPSVVDLPDWAFCGYQLEKIFQPTPLRQEDQASELEVSDDEEEEDKNPFEDVTPAVTLSLSVDEDEDEEPAPKKKGRPSSKVADTDGNLADW